MTQRVYGELVRIAFVLVVFFACSSSAHAALLYFDPDQVEVARGDTVTIGLRLDVDEGECINTVDAVIHYDASVRAVDVSRGDSILNLWVENPIIDEEAHTIRFAGGIPGGYCGRIPGDPGLTNTLLKLIFRSPGLSIGGGDNQQARIWIDESTQVLLHDGYGSNANVMLQESKIILLETPGSTPTDTWKGEVQSDDQAPSDFVITLTNDEFAFSGRHFITFNAIDKQSGIDHYEVMEEPFSEFYTFKWGRADAPWIITESPYVLKDQTLNSTIRVKAIDKAGNEKVSVLVPDVAQRSMSKDRLFTLLLGGSVVLLSLILIGFALWKRRSRLIKETEVTDEQNHV